MKLICTFSPWLFIFQLYKFKLIHVLYALVLYATGVICICFYLYRYLLSTSIICSNVDIQRSVIPKLCDETGASDSELLFYSYASNGFHVPSVNLCNILCTNKFDVSCHIFHLNKQLVFTVNFTTGSTSMQVVVKSVIEQEEDEDAYWQQKSVPPYIPTADELQNMVNTYISSFTGRQSDETFFEIKSYMFWLKTSDLKVHKEYWKFIHDHEFLLSYLFSDYRVFPKIVGTCGNLYGVEYAKPLIENPLFPLDIPWNMRINKSVELLRFMEKLQTMWLEPIHLCDIKHDHFGWNAFGELLFLDLDCVETASSLKNIMLNSPNCSNDEDCSYFDCHGQCLPNKRCSENRTNSNLQVLCSKIFLGNSDSSFFKLAGLLLDFPESESLHKTLELCSVDPEASSNTLIEELINLPQYYHEL